MTAHQVKTVRLDMDFHDHDGVALLHQKMENVCADKPPKILEKIFDAAVGSFS